MLSAGSFSSPYEHLSQPETKRMVEHYTAYLSDNTRLIANPGLKVHSCCWPRFCPCFLPSLGLWFDLLDGQLILHSSQRAVPECSTCIYFLMLLGL